MPRRRRPSRKTYSLAYLLSRQPKSLRKHPDYAVMIAQFRASRPLQQARCSRLCYSLLNNARIAEENLFHFYRTYRLPRDPFFPLFLKIKREYLAERERVKAERREYILGRVRSLPPSTLATIKYLGHLERYYNSANHSPLWQRRLFPSTKKQADAYHKQDTAAWLELFRRHLESLRERYGLPTEIAAERILACFVLGIIPDHIPPRRPEAGLINRSYRRLSLLHHPDRGGDPAEFIEVHRARDTLIRGQ